jgi:hypothetical protein
MFSTHLNSTEHSMNGAGHLKYKNRVNILYSGYVFKEKKLLIKRIEPLEKEK